MVQQIERTSRRWKALQLLAFLVMAAGLGWFALISFGDAPPASLRDPVLWGSWTVMGIGLFLSIAAQFGAWWQRG
ncbi:MAG: hypothetical protein GEU89_03675 [Kiloniellaceae bacterium]|jgi:hypothetical protein|nr:hypothetical protein [Kiloniellaceae bacterium]